MLSTTMTEPGRPNLIGPLDVGDVVLLVGVDEEHVEGLAAFGQSRQCVQRGADDDLDSVGDACPLEVLPRHLGVPWVRIRA